MNVSIVRDRGRALHGYSCCIMYMYVHVSRLLQVLSSSVSCTFEFLKEEFMGTGKFCRMFDRCIVCLNTKGLTEGREKRKPEKRKPDLEPYRSDKTVD